MLCKMSGKHVDWKTDNIVIISMNCFNQSTTNSLYTITTSFIPKQSKYTEFTISFSQEKLTLVQMCMFSTALWPIITIIWPASVATLQDRKTSLETLGYNLMLAAWWWALLFWDSTHMWQTERHRTAAWAYTVLLDLRVAEVQKRDPTWG